MFLNLYLSAEPPLPSSSLIPQPFSQPPITAPHLHLLSLNFSHNPPQHLHL
ncbi:hypothetical protein NC653_027051 [Populus alba x Populus x berolinensis]|uniref:Uncharacterized protein n=1 Tax=Populus alba x Populus x berolinensis TaxID=444605 RepID=A0AAD6Q6C7_9ROSI|nr:hypothetical protein NC653_027051 [Populus alba x Populus x berolinensis]